MIRSVLSREEKIQGIVKMRESLGFAGVRKRNGGVPDHQPETLTLAWLWDASRWASRVSLAGRMHPG